MTSNLPFYIFTSYKTKHISQLDLAPSLLPQAGRTRSFTKHKSYIVQSPTNITHRTPTPPPTLLPDRSWLYQNQTDPIPQHTTPYPRAPLGRYQLLGDCFLKYFVTVQLLAAILNQSYATNSKLSSFSLFTQVEIMQAMHMSTTHKNKFLLPQVLKYHYFCTFFTFTCLGQAIKLVHLYDLSAFKSCRASGIETKQINGNRITYITLLFLHFADW